MTSPNATFSPAARETREESASPEVASTRRSPGGRGSPSPSPGCRSRPRSTASAVRPREPLPETGTVPRKARRNPRSTSGGISPAGRQRRDAEQEQPAVPVEPARTENRFAVGRSGFSANRATSKAPRTFRERFSPARCYPYPVEGWVGGTPRVTNPPLSRASRTPSGGWPGTPDVAMAWSAGCQDHGVLVLPGDGRARTPSRGCSSPPAPGGCSVSGSEVPVGEVRRVLDAGPRSIRVPADDGEEAQEGLPIIGTPPVRFRNCFDRRARLSGQKPRSRPARHHHRVIHGIAPGKAFTIEYLRARQREKKFPHRSSSSSHSCVGGAPSLVLREGRGTLFTGARRVVHALFPGTDHVRARGPGGLSSSCCWNARPERGGEADSRRPRPAIQRIPGYRTVYSTIKQLTNAFSPRTQSRQGSLLVEYPKEGRTPSDSGR